MTKEEDKRATRSDEALRRVASLEAEVRKLAGRIEQFAKPIEISCFTNIDEFRDVTWPAQAAYPPQVGERISGSGGGPGGRGGTLRVVGVTHCVDRHDAPYLRVELHR